jgi:hypothetical protein
MRILLISILTIWLSSLTAQCDFYEDIIGLSISGATAGDNTQQYVLVSVSNGNIQAINNTPDFMGLSAGNYEIYAINYEGSQPIEIAIGLPWLGTSAVTSCYDASDPYLANVCENVIFPIPTIPCEFIVDIIGLSISGATAGDNVQQYVLVNSMGNIQTIATTPDFIGLTAGDYWIYAINYVGALPSVIAVGNSWSFTTGITSCFDASAPYPANVCDSVVPPTPSTPCEFIDDITGLTITGATGGDNTQEYVLISVETGNIVQVSNVADFFNLNGGDYQVYAINYEGTRPMEITVDNPWSATVGISSCFDASDAYVTNVCESICENENLVVSSTGFNNIGGFSQIYILVDLSNDQIVSTNTTGTFSASLYAGNEELVIYALNTDDTILLTSITIGADWSAIEADIATACTDLIGPRSISVLIITNDACCNDTVKGFVR